MNLQDGLCELRSTILNRIGEAAQKGETTSVTTNSKMLEELEEIREAYESLQDRFGDLKDRFEGRVIVPPSSSTLIKPSRPNGLSAKAKGKQRRQNFIERASQKGAELSQVKGVTYKSPRSNLIGIASASESKKFPGQWLLGLPPGEYDTVVLLCEDSSERLFTFIPPTSLVRECLPKLSTSLDGQIKFNVRKSNNKFYLSIPKEGRQQLDNMLDRFDNL